MVFPVGAIVTSVGFFIIYPGVPAIIAGVGFSAIFSSVVCYVLVKASNDIEKIN